VAGLAVSVVAGVVDVDGVAGVAAAGSVAEVDVVAGALLVVDGSPAGLLSLPPQAVRTAMAERTRSFFMMLLPPRPTFSALSRGPVKEKWHFGLRNTFRTLRSQVTHGSLGPIST
jgi:hypothetical protein